MQSSIGFLCLNTQKQYLVKVEENEFLKFGNLSLASARAIIAS